MPLPVVETSNLLLEADLLALMLRWRGNVAGRIEVDTTYGGLRGQIVIEPVPSIPIVDVIEERMSPCEADILQLLRSCGKRLTRPEICQTLEGNKRFHGERTVIEALAALYDRGLIERPRPGSRDGYACKI